ncbi:MAG: hypothetical protein AB1512_12905 [Thermodesulfobacteriota bacterium]
MRTENTGILAHASTTQDIMELLILRLSQRGLLFPQIPRFIKDVKNMLRDSDDAAAMFLNERLDRLGWGKQVLDEFTLQLIIYLAENPDETPAPSIH